MTTRDVDIALRVLAAATQVVDGIQAGLARRGYHDVRPAHGFAFARISQGPATVVDVAQHLGVTKQAASQLVEQLVARKYVRRVADADDGRRWLLTLTARGRSCTQAAEAAAAEAAAAWQPALGKAGMADLHRLLGRLELTGPLRPSW